MPPRVLRSNQPALRNRASKLEQEGTDVFYPEILAVGLARCLGEIDGSRVAGVARKAILLRPTLCLWPAAERATDANYSFRPLLLLGRHLSIVLMGHPAENLIQEFEQFL